MGLRTLGLFKTDYGHLQLQLVIEKTGKMLTPHFILLFLPHPSPPLGFFTNRNWGGFPPDYGDPIQYSSTSAGTRVEDSLDIGKPKAPTEVKLFVKVFFIRDRRSYHIRMTPLRFTY